MFLLLWFVVDRRKPSTRNWIENKYSLCSLSVCDVMEKPIYNTIEKIHLDFLADGI